MEVLVSERSNRFSLNPKRLSMATTKQDEMGGTEQLNQEATKTGWLHKRGGGKKSKAWKRRYFILDGSKLLYFKSDKERKPQGVILVSQYMVVSGSDDPKLKQFNFSLVPKKIATTTRTYQIHASSSIEKAEWMAILQSVEGGTVSKASVLIEEKLRRNCYDIPPSELEWGGTDGMVLGKGGSGVVKKGLWLKTTEVAIKALNNLPEFTNEEETLGFYKEIETLSQLRHPNIVPMFGYCKKDGYLCLVTEFVKGGDLSKCLHNPPFELDVNLKLELCSSICRGMVYLHNKNITHRDLKPQNILVEALEDAKVKVCDFGLSSITKPKDEESSSSSSDVFFGSPAYAAPELPLSSHTNKVDIYEQLRPWDSPEITHSWQIAERIGRGERLPISTSCPLELLITRCWASDPNARPTFVEIYEELERIKSLFPPLQRHSRNSYGASDLSLPDAYTTNTPSPAPNPPSSNSSEMQILRGFGNKVKNCVNLMEQSSLPWASFVTIVERVMMTGNATEALIEQWHYTLGGNETVEKDLVATFLEWFTPLASSSAYQTDSVGEVEGYELEQISEIVSPSWFFGFLSAADAKELLMKQPVGSFLFRFSSNAGCYTLSVNYGQVGHWRISTEKNGSAQPVFRVEGRPYRSLYHIIETHSVGGEPLTVKGNETISSCFLSRPVNRSDPLGNQQLYSDFY